MNAIRPNIDQFKALLAAPDLGPVVMLNLLKFTLVQYPSRAAFVEMTSSSDDGAAHEHREAGLERTLVVACSPRDSNL